MIEFELGGEEYRANKLDAVAQFNLQRRIAPLIPSLAQPFLEVMKIQGKVTDNLAALLPKLPQMTQPFLDALAAMSDETSAYVINACMSTVRRKVGDEWMPVWKTGVGTRYDDINDAEFVLQIVIRVIKANLGPFISGLLTRAQTGALPEK